MVGLVAALILPVAEWVSGFLLGNLHPRMGQFFIFSGRWAFDAGCGLAVALAVAAWWLTRRDATISAFLLALSFASPLLGRAWLIHVDQIVSY